MTDTSYQRLTAQDTTFLHVEQPGTPQHTGGLLIVEGAPFFDGDGNFRLDDVRRRIESRLHLMPLMRKRLMWVPLQQGRPVWVDDDRFDIAFHVRHTAVPAPGTREQLLALFGRLQAHQLDRRRALWELWFVEGLESGEVALIMKTHHCMVDGVSSVDLLTTVIDLQRDVPDVDPQPWEPQPAPEPGALLAQSLVERITEPVELARSLRAAVRLPQVRRMLRTVTSSKQAVPWNVPVSPHRLWIPLQLPLDDVKAIKAKSGATVNDVVLAACTAALRAFLQDRGEPVEGRDLKAAVPVSVRSESEKGSFGNRVSAVIVELPVGEADAAARLATVHDRMRDIKETNMALGAEALVSAQEYLAPTLLALAARQFGAAASQIDANITNVPGPQFPLYCMGAEVRELYPYVGLAHGLALSIAVISYNGQVGFGVTTDPEVLPDLGDFVRHLQRAFDEMLEACT